MTSFLNREIPNSSDPKEKNYLLGSSFKKKCGGLSSWIFQVLNVCLCHVFCSIYFVNNHN